MTRGTLLFPPGVLSRSVRDTAAFCWESELLWRKQMFAATTGQERRLIELAFQLEDASPYEHGYARPVEGLIVTFDLDKMVVLDIEDHGVVPLPPTATCTNRLTLQGLPEFVVDDAPLEDSDVVLWYTLGAHHIVRPEDWPVMPCAYTGFHLKPIGFFDGNPALDLPPSPPKVCHGH